MTKDDFFKAVSVFFHPVFIPLITIFIHIKIFEPYIPEEHGNLILYITTVGTLLLPSATIILLKKVKIITSFQIENKKERMIPVFTTGVYVFITAKILMQNNTSFTLNTCLIGIVITDSTFFSKTQS